MNVNARPVLAYLLKRNHAGQFSRPLDSDIRDARYCADATKLSFVHWSARQEHKINPMRAKDLECRSVDCFIESAQESNTPKVLEGQLDRISRRSI